MHFGGFKSALEVICSHRLSAQQQLEHIRHTFGEHPPVQYC